MRVRGPNNVGRVLRAVKMDPTLFSYAGDHRKHEMLEVVGSKSLTGLKLCAISSNKMQRDMQTEVTYSIQQ